MPRAKKETARSATAATLNFSGKFRLAADAVFRVPASLTLAA